MVNWKLLTGPFAGEVCEEGKLIDVEFSQLDADLQQRVKDFAKQKYGGVNNYPHNVHTLIQDYESSWESEETEEEVTVRSLSSWQKD